MTIDKITNLVCTNDLLYPGQHQELSNKTKIQQPSLTVNAQLNLIWKTFCEYVFFQLSNNTSVKVDNLGTFTFSLFNQIPTNNSQSFSSSITKPDLLRKKKMIFILSPSYQPILKHYTPVKVGLLQPKEGVIVSKPEVTWNPTSIGYICKLSKETVYDGVNAILKAIYDLVKMKKRVEVNMGFCKIIFDKGEMSYYYYYTSV